MQMGWQWGNASSKQWFSRGMTATWTMVLAVEREQSVRILNSASEVKLETAG